MELRAQSNSKVPGHHARVAPRPLTSATHVECAAKARNTLRIPSSRVVYTGFYLIWRSVPHTDADRGPIILMTSLRMSLTARRYQDALISTCRRRLHAKLVQGVTNVCVYRVYQTDWPRRQHTCRNTGNRFNSNQCVRTNVVMQSRSRSSLDSRLL